jgi:Flp pilus assembly protein TadD
MPILRNGWRALAGGAALALVALVVVLQSRAAWLAVLAGFVTAGYAVLLWPRTFGLSARVRLRLAAAAVSVALAAATAIAVAPEDNPLVRRFRSIFATVCATAAPADEPPPDGGRLMVWGITARMIGDHPLAGVGAGNFTVRLHEYFGDEDLDFSEIDTNWLQPHNDFLWVAAEKGLPGLVSFLGCMVAALVAAGIVLRSAASPVDRWLTLAATSALVSFLVLACFDFPLERINHQVHLAVMLAVVTTVKHRVRPAAWTQPGAAAATAVSGRFAGRRLVVLVPLAAVLSLGVAYALAALRQEREVIVARRSWREGRWDDVVAASRRGKTSWKTLDPLASPVVFLEGMARARLGDVEGAIACLEAARVQNPNRMYVINNLGILYARTGRFEDAIGCFTLAARRYPHRIEPFNNLANCLVETGRAAEAVALLEQIPEAARTDAVRANLAHARESAAGAKPPGLEPAAVPAP